MEHGHMCIYTHLYIHIYICICADAIADIYADILRDVSGDGPAYIYEKGLVDDGLLGK